MIMYNALSMFVVLSRAYIQTMKNMKLIFKGNERMTLIEPFIFPVGLDE